MNLSKLTKQLKRDLKASPAKAAALVVLFVVAVVFWGPLVFKKEEPMKRKGATVAAAAETSTLAPSAGSAEQPWPTWRELAQRLEQDERMTISDPAPPPAPDAASLNPFDVETVADRDAAEVDRLLDEAVDLGLLDEHEEQEAPLGGEASLADCPLMLSSTLVGPKPKAVINGVPHALGRRIGTWNGKPLKLERIAPRSAVVAWNGQVRELRIPAPGETSATSDEGERGADPPLR